MKIFHALLIVLVSSPLYAAVNINWIIVGDPGNVAQSSVNRTHTFSGGDGYGSVEKEFQISRDETTIEQYVEFLNAKAKSDPYGLYNVAMATDANSSGISRSGVSGSYVYSVIGSGDRPITYVSWFDAARFTNWMNNGQGSGDTETGAYTLIGGQIGGIAPAKNVGATVWIPTENEWFKAAYYDPTKNGVGGYWLHGNRSDVMTSNSLGLVGSANYYDGDYAFTQSSSFSAVQNYITAVGAFGAGSQSYYGLNDVAGNVWEWNDLIGAADIYRGLRGGSWSSGAGGIRSSSRFSVDAADEGTDLLGFRVASVPEVSAIAPAILFVFYGISRRKR